MEDIAHNLGTLIVFSFLAAIIIGPTAIGSYYRNRERERLHETLRLMVEKGQPVSGELLESINGRGLGRDRPRPPRNDMRRGVMLMSLAFALAGLGLALGLTDVCTDCVGGLIGLAAFPGFVGLGYVVLALVNRNKPQA